MEGLDSRFEYNLEVRKDKKGRKERMVQMEIRYGKVRIRRSKSLVNRDAYSCPMEIQVVYVKEKAGSMHEGESPIEWMLYTTCLVENKEDALKIVGYYPSRWLIEDLFRTIKRGGLNYERSE
jgi:hypothetical protein